MKITGPGWPTERGWYAIALFIQTMVIFGLLQWGDGELRKDEFFKSLATAVVVTGWIGFAVGMRGNAEERKQTTDAISAVHEMARSMPNTGTPDVMLKPGETAKAEDHTS